MSKFGLDSPASDDTHRVPRDLSERLAEFPAVTTRHTIDVTASDAAAAAHGFVSREAAPQTTTKTRRRVGVVEPTRHLAIRLTETQYARFVAYADEYQLTYQDAVVRLLDRTGH